MAGERRNKRLSHYVGIGGNEEKLVMEAQERAWLQSQTEKYEGKLSLYKSQWMKLITQERMGKATLHAQHVVKLRGTKHEARERLDTRGDLVSVRRKRPTDRPADEASESPMEFAVLLAKVVCCLPLVR